MRRTGIRGRLLVIAVILLFSGLVTGHSWFISPAGRDSGAGTWEDPWASLDRVRTALRDNRTETVRVWLRGGVYRLEEAVRLEAEQSGQSDAPIVFSAWPGEEVRLVGGIALRDWSAVSEPIWRRRLRPEARDHVVWTDLRAAGVSWFGSVKNDGLELFCLDRPMTLARWPNEGFVMIEELLEPGTIEDRGRRGSRRGVFRADLSRAEAWTAETDIWVHGYWFYDWADERLPVAQWDPATGWVTLSPPEHVYGYRVGQWFYWLNLLAELDQPGEWMLDRESGRLFFWPPDGADPRTAVVSQSSGLLRLEDVHDVRFEGLILEACRGTAVTLIDCQRVELRRCLIRNCGRKGVWIEGGRNNRVTDCEVTGTGDGGIEARGGDRQTLTPGGHAVLNNHIHGIARWNRMYRPAVWIDGVGLRVEGNGIHDCPHIAIRFSGNDHRIVGNVIHDVCLEAQDAGAIYAGRDWSMRGTVIQWNTLHDIKGLGGAGAVGIYLDDLFSGTEIRGNVLARVSMGVLVAGGRDNLVEGNLFVDCHPAVQVDARGLAWASGSVQGTLTRRLQAVPYRAPPWSQRYPELVSILEEEPGAPLGNRIAGNLEWAGQWTHITQEATPYVQLEENHAGLPVTTVLGDDIDVPALLQSVPLGVVVPDIPWEQMRWTCTPQR